MTIVDHDITVINVADMSEEDYKQCLKLNMGEYGLMRRTLISCREGYTVGQAIYLKADNVIVSWRLLFEGYAEPTAYFYTHSDHRRKHYGLSLSKVVMELNADAKVIPWDHESRQFF